MKKLLKILKVTALTTISVVVVLLLLSVIFRDGISKIFINELNKSINTTVTISRVNFSLLRNFPLASVEFKDVRIDSPDNPLLITDSLSADRPLLEATSLYASFRIMDLIRKKYNIEKIEIYKSFLFIDTYHDNINNLDIWKNNNRSKSSVIEIDLKNVLIKDTDLIVRNRRSGFFLNAYINNASGKILVHDNISNIDLKANADIKDISSKKKNLLSDFPDIDLEGNILAASDSLLLEQCVLRHGKTYLNVTGPIYTKKKSLKLDLKSNELEINTILPYLPDRLRAKINKHIKSARISPSLVLKGSYKPKNQLRLGGKLDIAGLTVIANKNTPEISVSSLVSELDIGLANPRINSKISISKFRLAYASTDYSGSASLINFAYPYIDLSLNGNINASELSKHHNLTGIESISGIIHSNIRLWGQVGSLKKFKTSDLLVLNKSINLNLINLNLKTEDFNSPIENIYGNIMIADNAWIDELSFTQSGQNIVANGKIEGLGNFLKDRKNGLEISSGIWADKLDIDLWRSGFNKKDTLASKRKESTNILENIRANLTFNIDSIIIGKFSSAQVDGSMNFKNKVINISYLNMLCLDGRIEGNVILNKNSTNTYLSRAWLELDNINIKKAFSSFNNFGQESITSNNLEGLLSGSLSVGLDLDSDFKPLMPTIYTTGNYLIRDGALINFEPLHKLSRFIEISELEEIRFAELKNDLIIKYNKLFIPTMDINSSAFNISLSGEQSFKGKYEYHLKVLLSDILGEKAKESDSYITEFGRVEDDGLGRTTLYLKVAGDKEESDISYDVQHLSQDIKEDLKEEKQNLKTILNEEYGWYKGDSLTSNSAEKSKRFKITWEESDNVEETKSEERPKGFKLFQNLKKKINEDIKRDTIIKKF